MSSFITGKSKLQHRNDPFHYRKSYIAAKQQQALPGENWIAIKKRQASPLAILMCFCHSFHHYCPFLWFWFSFSEGNYPFAAILIFFWQSQLILCGYFNFLLVELAIFLCFYHSLFYYCPLLLFRHSSGDISYFFAAILIFLWLSYPFLCSYSIFFLWS